MDSCKGTPHHEVYMVLQGNHTTHGTRPFRRAANKMHKFLVSLLPPEHQPK
jgi:hypothetical protein